MLRFTIRDLLWLMVVVATASASVTYANRLLYLSQALSRKCEEQQEKIWELESQMRYLKSSKTAGKTPDGVELQRMSTK